MKRRIDILRKELERLEIDAVYLTSKTSHRYFTGFDNEDGAILITKQGAYAFEDFRYTEIANKLLSGVFTVIQPKGKRSIWLGEIIEKESIQKLGVEDQSITLSQSGCLNG